MFIIFSRGLMNKTYLNWLKNIEDENVVKKLKKMSEKGIERNFSSSLSFGTGGIRGKMELGTNTLNEVLVAKFAFAFLKFLGGKKAKIVIAYDTRNNSKKFAEIMAKILSEKEVYLFNNFVPTPICVFATTFFKADFGIMITASHNHREYNGIKVFDQYGIQIDTHDQETISKAYNATDEVKAYNEYLKLSGKKIQKIGHEIEDKFIENKCNKVKKSLKIVYTPLNGTGYYAVSRILKQNGFDFKTPKSQKNGNGEFKTCPYPNPEFVEAFSESLKIANDADIIIATDPDADRLGVMARKNGEFVKLSGNEVGYILAENILSGTKNKTVVTSVVTSPLIEDICKNNEAKLCKTLTGFKNLGRVAKELQDKNEDVVLIYEESCGYSVEKNFYDKDGIKSALKICEIAEALKKQNKTLFDYLDEIYAKYGRLYALSDSIIFENSNDMQKVMEKLRKTKIEVVKIEKIIDYLNDNTGLEKQNFLEYEFKTGSFIIRPSGTEPKLKIYVFVKKDDSLARILVRYCKYIIDSLLKTENKD